LLADGADFKEILDVSYFKEADILACLKYASKVFRRPICLSSFKQQCLNLEYTKSICSVNILNYLHTYW